MEEPNLSGGLGGSAAEGNAASAMGNSVVNSRLSVDLKMLEGLNKELNTLNENTKKIKSNFKDLIRNTKDLTAELNKAATAMGKVSGKSSSGYMDMSKGMPEVADLSAMREMQMQSVERILGALGKGGGGVGGGGGTFSKIKGGLSAFAANAAVEGAAMIDERVDRNKGYALSADKLSVQLQQQYGMSQMDVMNKLRGPLRSRRLGYGGINELLSMQSRTGIDAARQAGSVEGLRTLMGYGYSAGDATQYIESLGQADTVNRMFMMTGTSLYGIGGQQKSAQQVNQDLIQRLGLNNREIIKAGRQSGSVIRQRLQMAGLDEGAQDLLLQYAESNVSFTEKGGKGFYDPSKKADRKRMGIEANYATQEEETTRTEVNREEQMYKRQADNYAQMEKNLQNVNKLLGEFEDRLSSIIGGKTSVRGFGQLFNILGRLGIPGMTKIGQFIGDPNPSGSASPGRIAAVNPTVKKDDQDHLAKLKPVLREPLTRLLMDRPGINIGGSYRSAEQQKQLFTTNYYRTDEKTDTYYDGSYWKKKAGATMAAPPGLSYHEIGLAADLTFATTADREWLKNNASKYGLDEFSRHGEPWHVQSTAYPASRKQYEGQGATYGTNNQSDTKYVVETTGNTAETGPMGQSGSNMSYEAAIIQQMSTAESIAAFAQGRTTTLLYGNSQGNSGGAGGGRGGSVSSNSSGKVSHGTTEAEQKKFYLKMRNKLGEMKISPETIASYLKNVSVRGRKLSDDEVSNFVKLTNRESKYDAHAYNPSDDTKDFSFGLLQLNLQGDAKNDLFRKYPNLKNDYSPLWDPQYNLEVAAGWLMADGDTNFRKNNIYHHWAGSVKNGPLSNAHGYKVPSSQWGDPSDKGYTPKNSTNKISTGAGATVKSTEQNNTFNINPTINLTSTGSVPMDAAKLAKEVTKLIDRELKMNIVRSS